MCEEEEQMDVSSRGQGGLGIGLVYTDAIISHVSSMC